MNVRFWSRLLHILRSRRVLASLTGVLVTVMVMWVPELEAVQDELMTVIMSVLLVGLGGASAYNRLRVQELVATLNGNDDPSTDTDHTKGEPDVNDTRLP